MLWQNPLSQKMAIGQIWLVATHLRLSQVLPMAIDQYIIMLFRRRFLLYEFGPHFLTCDNVQSLTYLNAIHLQLHLC